MPLLGPTWRVGISWIRPGTALYDLEGLAHRLELRDFLPLELDSDLLESSNIFLRVQSFSAVKTNLRTQAQEGGVLSSPQEFLHFFINHFAAADGAPLEWHHSGFLLSRLLIPRSGSA